MHKMITACDAVTVESKVKLNICSEAGREQIISSDVVALLDKLS